MLSGRRCGGMTLVEIVVGLALFAMLSMMAAPSVAQWLRNNRIRSSAQTILGGLQFAQAEAVSRNARVRFQLTTTAGDDCSLSRIGGNWVVNLDPYADPAAVEGHCAAAPSDEVEPRILSIGSAAIAAQGAAVVATAPTVAFNGLGRPTPRPDAPITIDVGSSSGTCAADGGQVRCMRIVVSSEGMLRMCDPARGDAGNPQAC